MALNYYLSWAEAMSTRFAALETNAIQNGVEDTQVGDIFMYFCYWLAAMYVVIEGYREIGLKDPAIDALLNPDKIAILKRYRHGVYHFQPDYVFGTRYSGLFAIAAEIMPWLTELRIAARAFCDEWETKFHVDGSPK